MIWFTVLRALVTLMPDDIQRSYLDPPANKQRAQARTTLKWILPLGMYLFESLCACIIWFQNSKQCPECSIRHPVYFLKIGFTKFCMDGVGHRSPFPRDSGSVKSLALCLLSRLLSQLLHVVKIASFTATRVFLAFCGVIIFYEFMDGGWMVQMQIHSIFELSVAK